MVCQHCSCRCERGALATSYFTIGNSIYCRQTSTVNIWTGSVATSTSDSVIVSGTADVCTLYEFKTALSTAGMTTINLISDISAPNPALSKIAESNVQLLNSTLSCTFTVNEDYMPSTKVFYNRYANGTNMTSLAGGINVSSNSTSSTNPSHNRDNTIPARNSNSRPNL